MKFRWLNVFVFLLLFSELANASFCRKILLEQNLDLTFFAEKTTIIIPILPSETQWKTLLSDIQMLPKQTEIIISVGTKSEDENITEITNHVNSLVGNFRVLRAPRGRAKQMNFAVEHSTREFVWFLHADSRVTPEALASLISTVERYPDDLAFFNLRFHSETLPQMRINEFGVRFRSNVLGMPFGDQGFAISKSTFNAVGRYVENAPYGEDHLLTWQVRQAGFHLRNTGTSISTSARKYEDRGWKNTTWMHMKLAFLQAYPEAIKLFKIRLQRLGNRLSR